MANLLSFFDDNSTSAVDVRLLCWRIVGRDAVSYERVQRARVQLGREGLHTVRRHNIYKRASRRFGHYVKTHSI